MKSSLSADAGSVTLEEEQLIRARDRSVIIYVVNTVRGSVYKHHACERKFCTCFRVLNEEMMCLLLVSLCGVRFHTADTL